MMITHYDLFAGIGGFSLALEEVFQDEPIRHIFCEWESFPTAVLRQHWPDGEFYGDIADLVTDSKQQRLERGTTQTRQGRTEYKPHDGRKFRTRFEPSNIFVTDTKSKRLQQGGKARSETSEGSTRRRGLANNFTIVTGGFPCQPFSAAGRRKGTADDRYQWPNMFEVIRNTSPDWVIAENVRGLVTWNEGLVLETVCADLESQGYEVQPFIIPAVAVGAPHRRDRVWIIARRESSKLLNVTDPTYRDGKSRWNSSGSNTSQNGEKTPGRNGRSSVYAPKPSGLATRSYPDWKKDWQEVAFATCDDAVDDGLSRIVDGVSYSRAKWRKDSLKAYGNGIVHQVAIEIIRAIKESNNN